MSSPGVISQGVNWLHFAGLSVSESSSSRSCQGIPELPSPGILEFGVGKNHPQGSRVTAGSLGRANFQTLFCQSIWDLNPVLWPCFGAVPVPVGVAGVPAFPRIQDHRGVTEHS